MVFVPGPFGFLYAPCLPLEPKLTRFSWPLHRPGVFFLVRWFVLPLLCSLVATPKESTSVALLVECKEHAVPLPLVACGEAPAYDCTVFGFISCRLASCRALHHVLWLLSADSLIAVLPTGAATFTRIRSRMLRVVLLVELTD